MLNVLSNSLQNSLLSRLYQVGQKYPRQIAVVDSQQSYNYQQLITKINFIAEKLTQFIAPGQHVGILLSRNCDYLAAAFAVWQAGGVYLPMDEDWPQSRIDEIIKHAHVKLILHAGTNSEGMQFISFNVPPAEKIDDSNVPAYIIHTSGTTGKAKGVVVSHASLLHLVDSHQKYIYRPKNLVSGNIALNASFCFDSSLERMALVTLGYCVHIVSNEIRKSPNLLIEYIKQHQINNIDLVPSHLQILIDAGLLKESTPLNLVIVGGEAIHKELWETLANSPIHFYNVYGPTENTINTTFCAITPGNLEPHIGKPFEGVDCLIVDEELKPCLPGETGELLIGGKHLALCYYNAREQTEKSFLWMNGQRFYRSGDLVKINNQNDLVFLGRLDDQIKVNGHRVELAEVHKYLLELPVINAAALTPFKLNDTQAILASVVLKDGFEQTSFSELTMQLKKTLPAYMIPAFWQGLKELPLTDNLKTDHKKLLSTWRKNQSGSSSDHPVNSMEAKVVQAWEATLNRAGFDLDMHFFASGGDSLSAMKLLVLLKKLSGISVELVTLFKNPTIRQMSRWLEEERLRQSL